MRKLHLSVAAAEDLENILQYTLDVWGVNQLNIYQSLLEETFDLLIMDPENPMVKQRDELFPGNKSVKSGHHVIFFRLKNNNIEIIRLLHEKMDFLSQFQEEE